MKESISASLQNFETEADEEVLFKSGISYVSEVGAEKES